MPVSPAEQLYFKSSSNASSLPLLRNLISGYSIFSLRSIMNTVSSHCLVHASCASIRSLWMASVTMGFACLNACVVSYCVTARAPTPLGPDRLPLRPSFPTFPTTPFSEPAAVSQVGASAYRVAHVALREAPLLPPPRSAQTSLPLPGPPGPGGSHTALPLLVSAAGPRVFLWHKWTLASGLPRNLPLDPKC